MPIFDRFRRRPEEEAENMAGNAMRDRGTGPYGEANARGTDSSIPRADVVIGPYGAQNDGGVKEDGLGGFSFPLTGFGGLDESLAKPVIGKEQIREAMHVLMRYKAGKARFDQRCIENEEWWKLRHWEHIKERGTTTLKTKSAWLLNSILGKHADAMDALPEPNCLPRASDDQAEAQILSKVVPVILQRNEFDQVWSDNWWKKLKAGVAFYGVFWDSSAENGLGDVAVRKVDPLSLFWEPGVTNLQDSRNIFHVQLVDNAALVEQYPELDGKLNAKALTVNEYLYDDSVDTSDKSPVVDWYYKKQSGGRTVLHYVKFVGETVLYATENEAGSAGGFHPESGVSPLGITDQAGSDPITEYTAPGADSLTERGLYDHGLYPFFADVLFPEEGTPTGYGYIDIWKDAQRQIDLMNNAIVANCITAATPRWLKRGDGGINEEEFADWTRPIVHVQGSIEETAIRQIQVQPLTGNYITILQAKIEEMKETSGNRDVNNGGAPSGVTAASAIAALQEQSGKLSRDQIQGSYSCYRQIVYCVIELIRQFYDLPRQFRIVGPEGEAAFVSYSNTRLQTVMKPVPPLNRELAPYRPVFDIEVTAQRQTAYSKLSYNELAIQFYQLGFFRPDMADQALAALEMMDFKGKEQIRQRIEQNRMQFMLMQQAMMAMAPQAAGGTDPKPMQETDQQGNVKPKNSIVEKARGQAQQATQPG